VVDAAAFPAVASALLAAVVMGDAGKFPMVVSTVASAADLVTEAVAFPAVALAIPTAAVMGDAGKIPAMVSAVALSIFSMTSLFTTISYLPDRIMLTSSTGCTLSSVL